MYQAPSSVQYFIKEEDDQEVVNRSNTISFKNLPIESYVLDSILLPVRNIFRQTSSQFLSFYLMSPTQKYCHLLDELELIHKVYFLQGVQIQRFLTSVFDLMDDPSSSLFEFRSKINMINGNFQECLGDLLLRSFHNLDKDQVLQNVKVNFEDSTFVPGQGQAPPKKKLTDYLQHIRVVYKCEWPSEIIIDKNMI